MMQIRLNDGDAAAWVKVLAGFTSRSAKLEPCLRLLASTEPSGGRLEILADGDMGQARVVVDCDCIAEGKTNVRADMLAGLLSRIPEQRMMLTADSKGLKIKAAANSYKVAVLADGVLNSHFDLVPSRRHEKGIELAVDAGMFLELLDFVQHASAVNDVRYYLNSVCLEFEADGGRITAVATDGHRLASASLAIPPPEQVENGPAGAFIIAARAAQKLASVLARTGQLTIWVRGSRFYIRDSAGFEFSCMPLEGRFPDWRRTIPQECIPAATDGGALCGALDRALILSADQKAFKCVRLDVDGKEPLQLSKAKAAGSETELDERLECDAGGKAAATLNPEYLLASLSAFGKVKPVLQFNRALDSPFKIEAEDGSRLAIIMPVRA